MKPTFTAPVSSGGENPYELVKVVANPIDHVLVRLAFREALQHDFDFTEWGLLLDR
eukprot:SAG31_NODE_4524_length_3165_cov_2.028702_4_plen_56_part_00